MKGLLLKDLYMIKAYCRSFLFCVVIFLLVFALGGNNPLFLMYPLLIVSMLPVTLFSYDEKSKWNLTCGTMPYEKRTIVSEKYVLMLCLLGVTMLPCSATVLVAALSQNVYSSAFFFSTLSMMLVVGIISPCVTLPFIFRFGAEKGRMIYIGMIMIASAIMVVVTTQSQSAPAFSLSQGAWWVLPGVLLLLPLSWRLSIRFYERKEC